MEKVDVYIEIERHNNIKYEYNHVTKQLEVDRVLDYPYFYPYAYGFIPNTIADDSDELDILILSDNMNIQRDHMYSVYIIGGLLMEDEKGMDEKLFCVFEEDLSKMNDIDEVPEKIRNSIEWFFTNYKNNVPNKWSRVFGFMNKSEANLLYDRCKKSRF